jgi:hypothetical protein
VDVLVVDGLFVGDGEAEGFVHCPGCCDAADGDADVVEAQGAG